MSTSRQRQRIFKEEGERPDGPGGRPLLELRCHCGRLLGRFTTIKAALGFHTRCQRCKARIVAGIAQVEKDP